MTDNVHEHELHAYVDGTLPEARRLEVEAWLAAHPADAERVQAWAAQNQSLHAAFDAVLNEPLPLNLVRATRRPALPVPFKTMAAMLAMLVTGLIGYAIGLGTPGQAPAAPPYLARDAAIAHAVFSPEARHPVEVDAPTRSICWPGFPSASARNCRRRISARRDSNCSAAAS